MNKYNKKMNAKKILVSFLLIASVLFFAATVSAYTSADLTPIDGVKINGDAVTLVAGVGSYDSIVTVGDELTVKVKFTADGNDSIKVKATLEGEEDEVPITTSTFDVEDGKDYTKTLTLEVPADFDEDLISDDFSLVLEIDGDEVATIAVKAQRTSYEASIKSVMVSSTVEAGQTVPVEVVLENIGYNDLEDMYVTVKIAELNIEKKAYFGDLVDVKEYDTTTDEDAENTVRGVLNLEVPYTAKAGKYTLVVKAENEEATSSVSKEITLSNSISDIAMKSGSDLVLINPTNSLKVYKLVYQSNEVSVILPAASTKAVPIEVPANEDYSFDVSVFSGETLLSTVKFSGSSQPAQLTSPVFVLTVILAIVFLVLLVALVVLITKKPQKTEEFGESYY